MPRYHDPYKEIAALRAKHGRDRSTINRLPNLKTAPGLPSLSDGFAPVTDNRARSLSDKFRNEDKRTMGDIQVKAARIRIVVSKSAYMYPTESDDPASVHRKGGN